MRVMKSVAGELLGPCGRSCSIRDTTESLVLTDVLNLLTVMKNQLLSIAAVCSFDTRVLDCSKWCIIVFICDMVSGVLSDY